MLDPAPPPLLLSPVSSSKGAGGRDAHARGRDAVVKRSSGSARFPRRHRPARPEAAAADQHTQNPLPPTQAVRLNGRRHRAVSIRPSVSSFSGIRRCAVLRSELEHDCVDQWTRERLRRTVDSGLRIWSLC